MSGASTVFIIVNHRSASLTLEAVQSITRSSDRDWCVYVVDNSEEESEVARLHDLFDGQGIALRRIHHPDTNDFDLESGAVNLVCTVNRGFAAANNVVLKALLQREDWQQAFLLNSDAQVLPDTIDRMKACLIADERLGLCGARVLNFPDTSTVQCLGGKYNRWTGKLRMVGEGMPSGDKESHHRDIDFPSGAAMVITKHCLGDIGLLHEEFFLYGEELYWAEKARAKHWKVDYCYNSVVLHRGGSTINGEVKGLSALGDFYWLRNRLQLNRMFFPLQLPFVYLFSVKFLLSRIRRRQTDRVKMYFYVVSHPSKHYRDYLNDR